ncbi:MAG: hypothetical protein AAF492_18905, partial [Verrucomicrobiota bacterium]
IEKPSGTANTQYEEPKRRPILTADEVNRDADRYRRQRVFISGVLTKRVNTGFKSRANNKTNYFFLDGVLRCHLRKGVRIPNIKNRKVVIEGTVLGTSKTQKSRFSRSSTSAKAEVVDCIFVPLSGASAVSSRNRLRR